MIDFYAFHKIVGLHPVISEILETMTPSIVTCRTQGILPLIEINVHRFNKIINCFTFMKTKKKKVISRAVTKFYK